MKLSYYGFAHQMGEVVNYMQLDTARLEHVVHSIHTTWDGALQVRKFVADVFAP
jgi:hypothetical protein